MVAHHFYSVIQSSIHYEWANQYSSDLGSTFRYNIVRSFETFPFPQIIPSKANEKLIKTGEEYINSRKYIMKLINIGLTKTYNLLHDSNLTVEKISLITKSNYEKSETGFNSIVDFRMNQSNLDNIVIQSYGWQDIDLRHDFYEVDYLPENDRIRFTIHPVARKEVLNRLLELNHQIHEEEVKAGLWDKKSGNKRTAKSKTKTNKVNEGEVGYGGLFDNTKY